MNFNNSLARDIIEWDIANWRESLYFWEKEISKADFKEKKTLELGARNGGLSLYFALKGCEVVCSDYGGPTEKAKEKHRTYKVERRIAYADIDATNINFPDCSFDVVAFKSLLGGLGKHSTRDLQEKAVNEMRRVLKPGGLLLFAENLTASFVHMFLRKKFISWSSYWRYVTIDEMNEFLKLFSEIHYKTFGFLGVFGRSEAQRNMLHVVDKLMNPVLPESAKYIIFGCAKK